MPNLAECSNAWDRKAKRCSAIIETPKGSRNKFKYNSEYETFMLGGLLPEGLAFPFDFGFVPRTAADDGDPMDIMILLDEPAHVGCLIEVRLIGVIEADQVEDGTKVRNDRLIGVAVHSHAREEMHSLSEVPKSVLDQVEEFFVSYNKSRGKKFKVKGRYGPKRAAAVLDQGVAAFSKKK